jgi:saccharopine dehydrogenase-like NADP-dependent oxidoreductase
MQTILVIGAGRSSTALIDYLGKLAPIHHWNLIIADASLSLAQEKIQLYAQARALVLDVMDTQQRQSAINLADVVISLLPAFLHPLVAIDCLTLGKHLLTASYVSPEMKALHEEAKAKGLLFLNEMGLDPGIDHLSAMRIIHQIQAEGGEITSFKSFCGGLIAPQSDDNPWGYKFTWNPRNVVLAGQSTAVYLEKSQLREVHYPKLFTQTEIIHVKGYGAFEAYPNRDSLSYQAIYNLPAVETMLRGTLRRPGYCAAWNVLVQLGMTNDHSVIDNSANLTVRQFTEVYLPGSGTLLERLAHKTGLPVNDPALHKVAWLELDDNTPIGLAKATPAQVLQQVLERKWQMQPDDRDLIVMQHQFAYTLQEKLHQLTSSLAVEGDDAVRTAMAKTVGLPLGIAARLLLQGRIAQRGVVIPVNREIYEPVLDELVGLGIVFEEEQESL